MDTQDFGRFFSVDRNLDSAEKKSNYYIDCRLTTLDPAGACLVGAAVRQAILSGCEKQNTTVSAVGGLTLGADPIALATAMASHMANDDPSLKPFVVRKEPKGHGKGKQIEGGFQAGDRVVAIDDVITSGGSTLQAIDIIEKDGGAYALASVATLHATTHRIGLPLFLRTRQ